MILDDVKIGQIYQHFKGSYYVVGGFARDTETLDVLVLYSKTRKSEMDNDNEVWARPLKEFTDFHPVYKVKRFELVENQ